MGLLKRETPEQRRVRLERERELDEIYQKAKFEAQKKAAKRDGELDGLKGKSKRSIMDRISAAGKEASKQIKMMEEIIGEPPKGLGGNIMNDSAPTIATSKKKSKKQQNAKQPIVIVIKDNKDEKKKQSNSPFVETWEL